jgi:hypothetical protein
MVEYYQLSSSIYLPRQGENYVALLSLDSMPSRETALYPYVKRITGMKLSPFDIRSGWGSGSGLGSGKSQCIYAIKNPYPNSGSDSCDCNGNYYVDDYLCTSQISILLKFLFENGYRLDYETSKLLMKSGYLTHTTHTNANNSKLIGFITK